MPGWHVWRPRHFTLLPDVRASEPRQSGPANVLTACGFGTLPPLQVRGSRGGSGPGLSECACRLLCRRRPAYLSGADVHECQLQDCAAAARCLVPGRVCARLANGNCLFFMYSDARARVLSCAAESASVPHPRFTACHKSFSLSWNWPGVDTDGLAPLTDTWSQMNCCAFPTSASLCLSPSLSLCLSVSVSLSLSHARDPPLACINYQPAHVHTTLSHTCTLRDSQVRCAEPIGRHPITVLSARRNRRRVRPSSMRHVSEARATLVYAVSDARQDLARCRVGIVLRRGRHAHLRVW